MYFCRDVGDRYHKLSDVDLDVRTRVCASLFPCSSHHVASAFRNMVRGM